MNSRALLPNLLLFLLIAAASRGFAADTVVTFHPASAMVHIGGPDGELPDSASTYALQMARGERQGFQFAVLPAGDAAVQIKDVVIHAEDEGSPKFTLYRVLAVNHTKPDDDPTFKVPPRRIGRVPDVLLPLAERSRSASAVRPAESEPPLTYYIDFETSRDSVCKNFRYTVSLECDGGPASFGVTVAVSNVTIPIRLPFRTATSWRAWNFKLDDYYGHPLTIDEKKVFWNFCLDFRFSPCSFYGDHPDPEPSALADLKARGLNVVCLMKGSSKPYSEQQKQGLVPQLKAWREELTKLGLEQDVFVLLADEPPPEQAEAARINGAWLKARFPELKLWVATRPASPWDEFTDVFDTITAHSSAHYAPHSHDEMSLRRWLQVRPYPNGEYWWFHSVEPYAPYTNVRLDNLPIEARVAGWQNAQYAVDGYEYFGIADWSKNTDSAKVAWPERAARWKTGLSGAGTLCYPDEKLRPMPSLRLVNLRDGIQDWAILEQLNGRHDRLNQSPALAKVTQDLAHYTTSPKVLLDARVEIFKALAEKTGK